MSDGESCFLKTLLFLDSYMQCDNYDFDNIVEEGSSTMPTW